MHICIGFHENYSFINQTLYKLYFLLFFFKVNLDQHVENHINLVSCNQCDVKCTSEAYLRNHLLKSKQCRRQSFSNNSALSTTSNNGSIGSFTCSDCSFSTNMQQTLIRHQRFRCKGKGIYFRF